MTIRHYLLGFSTVCGLLWGCQHEATAAPASDALMSSASRGFVSIADLTTLTNNWNATQLGQLVQDKAMQPFVQDMRRQLERKLSGVRDKLGVDVGDLREAASGEVGLAMIERPAGRAAVAMTIDVTGRLSEAAELLVRIDRDLAKRGARRSIEKAGNVPLTVYAIPPQGENDIAREAVFGIRENILLASDSRAELEEMLQRFSSQGGDRLADVPAYQATMERCQAESHGLTPEVRWYLDPFGYARAVRSLRPAERRFGKDYLKILSEQGFDAIQGVGGFVNLAAGGAYELLHRTAVYAPPLPAVEDQYRLAMRMMKFPNEPALRPQPWIPRKLASYRTLSFDVDNGFEHFDTLFNAIAGYPDAFEGVLEGLQQDPYGPQVEVRREFIKHLGNRVTLITDYEVPITTKSERFLFLIAVTNQEAVAQAVEKFMNVDPHAHRRQLAGHTVWEILTPDDEFSELEIGSGEFDPLAPIGEPRGSDPNREELGVVKNSAVCVHDGHMMISSHIDFLEKVLTNPAGEETLGIAGDFREVDAALSQLLEGPVAARCFVRTDEAYRPTYELLRQGKMPESETLLGRVLNRLLTPEDEEEGVLRKQKIDGRDLPSFEMVRRYFSPGGTIVRSEADGWFIVGATLSKRIPQARVESSNETRY